MANNKVLVTGGAGYIGSLVVRALLDEGYDVLCVDRLDFGGESLLQVWRHPRFSFERCDINDHDAVDRTLHKHEPWAVVHLAAIVGDPACAREPDEALRTNWTAPKFLVDRSRDAGVERFVFASTCSNYGRVEDPAAFVDETSPLKPLSLYAELKVRLEKYLLEELPEDPRFVPTVLRFATVYGASPRTRFDLTLNEFTKDMALGKTLKVYGPQYWRPYCHVQDFARACVTVLAAPADRVANDVFNVGDTSQNYTKQMLLDELLKVFPNGRVEYVEKVEDPRSYRVNSDKIRDRLGFRISRTVPEGIREIAELVVAGVFRDCTDARYYNIPYSQ